MKREDFESQLTELIAPIKEYIKGIELVGSYANPYIIKTQNDYDVNLYFNTEQEKREACHKFCRIHAYPELRDKGIDLHFVEETFNIADKVYAYQTMFLEGILGYERVLPKIDILQDTLHTKEVIKSLLDFTRRKEQEKGLPLYKNKYWYHAYTELCILNNNSYQLTQEQINNIGLLHDRREEDQDKRKEIIDEMIKEIELWQI